jgi:hypothetical protein
MNWRDNTDATENGARNSTNITVVGVGNQFKTSKPETSVSTVSFKLITELPLLFDLLSLIVGQ